MITGKKELAVAALENGTVIDHIPSNVLFKVVDILGIANLPNNVTIGNNLESKCMGKKGIVKIADMFFTEEEINRIAVIAPTAKINIIRNFEVVNKYNVALPDEIVNIVKCNNPKCITNNEPMKTIFNVIDRTRIHLQCHYCGKKVTADEIHLK